MIRLGKALTLVSLLSATIFSGPAVASWHSSISPGSLSAKRLKAVKLREAPARRSGAGNVRRAGETSTHSGVKNITFSNPKASGAYYYLVHASFVLSYRVQSSTWTVEAFPT